MNARHVRDPEHLSVYFNAAQSAFRQVFFFQTKESEMGEIAQHSLKPPVLRQDFAHARILEFIHVEGEHRDVLRSAGSRN